ncbi:MAG: ferritin [Desulfohalobiaceae bacterium]|nr:ferritin [Desulfohalobiaceae bacterium]
MLTQNMQKSLNDQITAETYSAYLYLSMAAYFEDQGLPGFSAWMKAQAQEELFHAMKFFNFVNDRGGRVLLGAIEQPPTEWASVVDVFQATLDHEKHVTSLINKLVDLAIEEKDHATNNFLQWFVGEQVEEEDTAGQILNKLKLMDQASGGLFMLDKELGQRTFVPPAAGQE